MTPNDWSDNAAAPSVPKGTASDSTALPAVFDGKWETTIATQNGKLPVMLSISTRGGIVQGTASQGEETVELLAPALKGFQND